MPIRWFVAGFFAGTIKNGGYELPPRAIARTGSGGFHYVFKTPGHECRNFADRVGATILPNVDFRGDGGLIVLAPSVNSNGPYAWQIRPDEQTIVEAPEWLSELISEQSQTGAISEMRGET